MRVVKVIAIGIAMLLETAAVSQASMPNEEVQLQSYDLASNTYRGFIFVRGSPCSDVTFSVSIPFDQAKSANGARSNMKEQINKVEKDFQQAAANCKAH